MHVHRSPCCLQKRSSPHLLCAESVLYTLSFAKALISLHANTGQPSTSAAPKSNESYHEARYGS